MVELSFGDLLSLVQTAAILVALLLTVYFARRQIQAYTTDLESRVLNDIDEKFHRIGELLIEKPQFVQTLYRTQETVPPELPLSFYILFFCSHVFHMRERGLLKDNEWAGWYRWMRKTFHQGTIGESWRNASMGEWIDPAFVEFVEKEILGKPLTEGEVGRAVP